MLLSKLSRGEQGPIGSKFSSPVNLSCMNCGLVSRIDHCTCIHCVNYKEVEHLHCNLSIPVYNQTSKHYSAKDIKEVLLAKHLPLNRIATCQPVGIEDNLVFVINLSQLEKPEDVRADDLGLWMYNGK